MTVCKEGLICFTLIAISGAVLSGYGEAADWVRFYANSRGAAYYFDGSSLVSQGNGHFRVWTKGMEFDPRGDIKKTRPLQLLQVDCTNKSSVILNEYINGAPHLSQGNQKPPYSAMPEPAVQALYTSVCR